MKKTISANRDEVEATLQQDCYSFILSSLDSIGLPKGSLSFMPKKIEDVSVDDRIQYRKLLKKFDIMVVEGSDGSADIKVGKQSIGSWKKTTETMKKVGDTIYIEVLIETSTLKEQNDRKTSISAGSPDIDEPSV